jgi:TRAP-type mannitol/chloroaromatic compound transport system permease small subunit
MQALLRVIDAFSEWTGRIALWLATLLMLLVSLEVTLRYVFNHPTMWNYETALMVGGTLYALGWAYCHKYRLHIRVDIIYGRLSSRNKAIFDVIGNLLFFFPISFALAYAATFAAIHSWTVHEVSLETYWYPPLWPFRAAVMLGFILFALQGTANFIRDLHLLIGSRNHD